MKVRWTITGEGSALERRGETWAHVCSLIEYAESWGMRVEVAEVEEEERRP